MSTFVVFLIGLTIALVVGPMLIIWALNVLFGLSIVLSFKTWFAVLVLVAAIRPTYTRGDK